MQRFWSALRSPLLPGPSTIPRSQILPNQTSLFTIRSTLSACCFGDSNLHRTPLRIERASQASLQVQTCPHRICGWSSQGSSLYNAGKLMLSPTATTIERVHIVHDLNCTGPWAFCVTCSIYMMHCMKLASPFSGMKLLSMPSQVYSSRKHARQISHLSAMQMQELSRTDESGAPGSAAYTSTMQAGNSPQLCTPALP